MTKFEHIKNFMTIEEMAELPHCGFCNLQTGSTECRNIECRQAVLDSLMKEVEDEDQKIPKLPLLR